MVRDLVGVSAGEFGSQVELILLGEVTGLPGGSGIINARTPGDLGRALREHRPPSANRPSMSTSDVALTFDARDVDCRFQPIVRLTDRAPVGMETLVRLNHQEYGTIGPDQFIPQIERAGLSLRLTDAVAYAAMASVDPALLDYRHLFVSINLPLDVLLFPEALQRIEGHRQQFAIPVERILIELTESRPVSDLAGLTYALERWRNAGYRVAIDDMGPEMMNQLNLFDLPFNVVKLDKQVVLRSQTDLLARNYLKRTVNKRQEPFARSHRRRDRERGDVGADARYGCRVWAGISDRPRASGRCAANLARSLVEPTRATARPRAYLTRTSSSALAPSWEGRGHRVRRSLANRCIKYPPCSNVPSSRMPIAPSTVRDARLLSRAIPTTRVNPARLCASCSTAPAASRASP